MQKHRQRSVSSPPSVFLLLFGFWVSIFFLFHPLSAQDFRGSRSLQPAAQQAVGLYKLFRWQQLVPCRDSRHFPNVGREALFLA
jgi:hypothetical protein